MTPRPDRDTSLGYASYVLLVLTICYTLSFIDRQILALLVAPIREDLGISDTGVGLLQGLAFAVFYTVLGVPFGRLADTRSRRTLISVGVLFWSLMTALCAGARSFGSLFLARMGVGVGEATLAPGAFSLITDYFSRKHLGRALSVYSMGIFVGSGLAFLVGGAVVEATTRMPAVELPLFGLIASWRLTFLIVGLPGLVVAFWLYTVREPARRNMLHGADGKPAALSISDVVQQIKARWQSIFGISLAMVFQSTCAYGLLAWTPEFLRRLHGWSPGQIGRALGLLVIFFGCLGMFVGGVLTDHWRQRGITEAPLRVGIIGGVGAGALCALAFSAPSVRVTIIALAPALVFLGLPMGTSFAALQLILPNQVRGQVSALFLFVLNLGGITLGPLVPALLSDYVFRSEQMIGVSLGLSIGVAAFLQIVTFASIVRPYRNDADAMETLAP